MHQINHFVLVLSISVELSMSAKCQRPHMRDPNPNPHTGRLTLYINHSGTLNTNGLSTLVGENDNIVSEDRRFCCRFGRLRRQNRRICILKQATVLPETATLYPETGDFVS